MPVLDAQINRLHTAFGKLALEKAYSTVRVINRPEVAAICSAIEAEMPKGM